MSKQLTIVIPAYNEAQNIESVIKSIQLENYSFVKEIIVVDDASTDNTAEIARGTGVSVIQLKQNQGYGAAIKAGIHAASAAFVLTFDADGQHHSSDIVRLWDEAEDNDLVVGARTAFFHTKLWRTPGKWLLRQLAVHLVRKKIPDLNSGLRLFRREIIIRYLTLCCDEFSFSSTSTMIFLYFNYSVVFLPIEVEQRKGKSTVKVKHGFDTLILILRLVTLFAPLRLFIPLSFLSFFVGLFWSVPSILLREGVSSGGLLLMLAGILFFMLGLLSDQISQMRLDRLQ